MTFLEFVNFYFINNLHILDFVFIYDYFLNITMLIVFTNLNKKKLGTVFLE